MSETIDEYDFSVSDPGLGTRDESLFPEPASVPAEERKGIAALIWRLFFERTETHNVE